MWKVPLFDLNYDEREEAAVLAVIHSKWLTMGPKTQEFEEKFAEYLSENARAIAVSSCTAALHMSLLAAGIKAGDEVIISGLSFVACLNVVTLVGATPVLADSKSLDDWNVSPKDIRNKITSRTRAIIVIHYAGYPCDMNEICQIAKENSLLLVEDVAHAVGASYRGSACGTFGDVACFSFFSNKNLSTGEGGMVVTSRPEIFEKLKLLRSHGMTSLTVERHSGKAISYDVILPGLNYRIDEIRSAIGLVQLEKLEDGNRKRRGLVAVYRQELTDSCLQMPWDAQKDLFSSCHIATVLLPKGIDRLKVIERMREQGIQTSIHYPAYRDFSSYRGLVAEVPVAQEISARVLTLPLYPALEPMAVSVICKVLLKVLHHVSK